MNRSIKLAALSAVLALSGCAGTKLPDQAHVDTAFEQACFAASIGHIGFGIAAATFPDKIDAGAVKWEATVNGLIVEKCAAPPPNVADAKALTLYILDVVRSVADVVNRAKAVPV